MEIRIGNEEKQFYNCMMAFEQVRVNSGKQRTAQNSDRGKRQIGNICSNILISEFPSLAT